MGRIVAGALALPILLATQLLAASRVNVQQLEEMLAAARASQLPDDKTAAELGGIELTERLTETTLARLWLDQGGRTKIALWILADESAFLDPPVSELPSEGPPDPVEQRIILAKAMNYALAYINNLPNFTCKQLTRRFQDDPLEQLLHPSGVAGRLHAHDTVETELTFSNGAESRLGRQPTEGLTTFGEFGSILASPFFSGGANAKWSHWEIVGGARVAVFAYSVDRAHSTFDLSWCCLVGNWRRLHEKVAYRGALFIEPASGAILRVTRQAANIPAGFPTRRSDTAVEYRPVNIGGKSWLCPVSSITSSDNSLEHLRENPNALEMHTLNVVQFTDYHKFGSESTLVMADIPATGQIDVSAPSMAPIEPPPELTATYQPASVPSLLFGRVESLPPPPSPKAPEAPVEGQAIFRVRTNVVTVRVVVRDRNGHPVGDLRKEEFELRDNGQPQTISSFSVERPTTAALQPISPEHGTKMGGEQAVVHEAVQVAYRYVMYVVDDLNIEFGDLSQTRTAAERVLRDSPNSASRVAVLTTSGRIITDFTSNLAEINKALDRITPQGRANAKGRCPPLSHGLALAVTQGYGLMLAIAEAKACGLVNDPSNPRAPSGPDSTVASAQRGVVLSVANQVVNEYRTQTRTVLEALKVAVRRISIVPGSRTLVLVSPGFLTPDLELEVNEVIDRAIRAGVVINTLDSRGVWVLPGFDAETRPLGDPAMDRAKRQSDEQEQQAQSYILGHLAAETGGLAFQSNNDYQEGFRRLTAAPQVSYVLGFTPTKLKPDGSFHILKVNIGTRKGLTAQARNGYFAPKRGIDPTEQAKEEIENAVFSRDEIQDIPVTLRTQMTQGKLSAVAHFGIGGIRFVQKDGRNRSSLTATVSLFDAVGNYLKGEQDIVNLDFPDDKLASAEASGDAVRADFEVPAGSYVVRLVLRDNDGHMSATSMIVTVP